MRLVAAVVAVWLLAAAAARVFGIWIAVGGAAVALAAALLVLARDELRGWLAPSLGGVVLGAGAGAVMVVATELLAPVLLWIPGGGEQLALLYAGFATLPPWGAILLLLPIIAGEELVWRGVVQARCVARWGGVRGVAAAAGLYAVAHAQIGSWVLCLAAAGCGAVWGALATRTRGLLAPFIAHVVWDVAVMFVAPVSPM